MKGTISNLLRMPNTPLTQDNKSVFTVANEPTGTLVRRRKIIMPVKMIAGAW